MPDEGFLRRWSRRKADGQAAAQPVVRPAAQPLVPPAAPAAADPQPASAAVQAIDAYPSRAPQRPDAAPAPALPTLADVARLDSASDFSAFVAKGVDKDVQRLAMKKLFADPHFNLIDRLDVYMDDYNKPSPVSAAMLTALHHTKNLFAPLASDAREADATAHQGAAAEAGEDAAATAGESRTGGDAAGAKLTDDGATDAATTGDGASVTAPLAAAAPDQPEPMRFYGAAAGGVLQQPLQGKA